jgi:hypothetical protein
MMIFAQVAGHQTIASTRIATASKKRQKQSFKEITPYSDNSVKLNRLNRNGTTDSREK